MFSEIQWMIFFCFLIDINDMQCVYQAAVSLTPNARRYKNTSAFSFSSA